MPDLWPIPDETYRFDAASLFKDLQVARDNDRDLITIACPIGLSEIIMPIAISKYLEFNPDVSVSMRSLSYVELMTSDAITSYDVMLSVTASEYSDARF